MQARVIVAWMREPGRSRARGRRGPFAPGLGKHFLPAEPLTPRRSHVTFFRMLDLPRPRLRSPLSIRRGRRETRLFSGSISKERAAFFTGRLPRRAGARMDPAAARGRPLPAPNALVRRPSQDTAGSDNLPKGVPLFIVASNHQSHLDTSALYVGLMRAGVRKVYALGAKDYFWPNPFIRWFVTRFMCVIPISRKGFTQVKAAGCRGKARQVVREPGTATTLLSIAKGAPLT